MNVVDEHRSRHGWTDRIANELRNHGVLLDVEYGDTEDDGDVIRAINSSRPRFYVSVDDTGTVDFCITEPGSTSDSLSHSVNLSEVPADLDQQLRQIAGWLL